jgi:hypothetical protein
MLKIDSLEVLLGRVGWEAGLDSPKVSIINLGLASLAPSLVPSKWRCSKNVRASSMHFLIGTPIYNMGCHLEGALRMLLGMQVFQIL